MVLPALIRKELLLLLRDWHALALLFLMPAAFILVMSLALQERFAADQGVSLSYYLVDQDQSDASRGLAAQLAASQELQRREGEGPVDLLREAVRSDKTQFLLIIPKGFAAALDGPSPRPVQLQAGPGVEPAVSELFRARLQGLLAELYLEKRLGGMGVSMPDPTAAQRLLHAESLYTGGARPSSVQQNVPAWLLFAMFFIAIPLSTTWVQERSQGTYARLRTMGVSPAQLLAGKLWPYLGITLVQAVLMLAVGRWIVPLLGGGWLDLGHAPLALLLMTLASGFAAVCYALLVANLVSTAEQATIFTGVANLLMAAVGGIMVPRFVMPAAMQAISLHSPMAWGLEGFLEVFLRQGGIAAVTTWALKLALFGAACLILAAVSMRVRHRS
ncbi:MAG TPA: ABC transporter permease [Gammaproteobacteria bacterium]|nr:ABC transporter permease [Gammaproteobacteria bacterium]